MSMLSVAVPLGSDAMRIENLNGLLLGQRVIIQGGGTCIGYVGMVVEIENRFPNNTVTVRHPITGVETKYSYQNVHALPGGQL